MFLSSKRSTVASAGVLLAAGLLCALPGASLAQALQPPVLLGTASTPPPPPPPTPTGAPPLSWNDARFSNVTSSSSTIRVASGATLANRSIVESSGQPTVTCDGTCLLTRVRVDSREALRILRNNIVIEDSWLEAQGSGSDHADTIQAYAPGSTGTLTIRRSTIRAYTGSATAGIFIADDWTANEVTIEDSVIWGGPYGVRLHNDGNHFNVSLSNVCFVGPFGTRAIWLNTASGGGGGTTTIRRWDNVRNCTIVNGQLVQGTEIARPN